MCYPVTCSTCKKTTWGGCGRHVDSVMRNVPASRRCQCSKDSSTTTGSGFFSRLFGR